VLVPLLAMGGRVLLVVVRVARQGDYRRRLIRGDQGGAQTVAFDFEGLRVKLFADSADVSSIEELAADTRIHGFTTNPTLMRKAGVDDYAAFARKVTAIVGDRPVSFEVFCDDFAGMLRQARLLAALGEHVHVKIPITDPSGDSSCAVLRALAGEGVRLNVTAVMTPAQVETAADALQDAPPAFVSLFAGRVADSGRDPLPMMVEALDILRDSPHLELMWASPREVLNVVQAHEIGCHVITLTPDLVAKLDLLGRDLDAFSLDTVRMFHRDAAAAGYDF
jgi:transaldolase